MEKSTTVVAPEGLGDAQADASISFPATSRQVIGMVAGAVSEQAGASDFAFPGTHVPPLAGGGVVVGGVVTGGGVGVGRGLGAVMLRRMTTTSPDAVCACACDVAAIARIRARGMVATRVFMPAA